MFADTFNLKPFGTYLENASITYAEHFKRTAHSVHYNSAAVCKFLEAVEAEAQKGRYSMLRNRYQQGVVTLDDQEVHYLKCQGFNFHEDWVYWG